VEDLDMVSPIVLSWRMHSDDRWRHIAGKMAVAIEVFLAMTMRSALRFLYFSSVINGTALVCQAKTTYACYRHETISALKHAIGQQILES